MFGIFRKADRNPRSLGTAVVACKLETVA